MEVLFRYPILSCSVAGSIYWKILPLFTRLEGVWERNDSNWVEKLIFGGIAQFARDWHEYEVHDLDRIVRLRSNCLLVGYHSRCTMDLFYLVSTIRCHVLVTHLLFYIPIIGTVLSLLGIIPSKGGVRESSEKAFVEALAHSDRPLLLLPGGAFECMKAFHDRYRVMWKAEPGFSRVISDHSELRGHTRVIPFYTKNSEQCLWSTAWWYTQSGRGVRHLMERFSEGQFSVLPVMMTLLLCSLGFFPLPAPCKLDTYFGEELIMQENESAAAFALRVKNSLHALIDRVNGLPPRPFTRSRFFYRTFLGTFTLIQNVLAHTVGISLLLGVLYPLLLIAQVLGVNRLFAKSKPFRATQTENQTLEPKKGR